MLKAPVEDCVAKNADSAVPERKRAPKKAKKGKEDATQTEPAAAARGKTVQQAARKGKGGAKPAGQAEADQGDQAPKGSGGAKRSQKKKAAAPTAGGEGGTQSDERVEDKGKDPMDESLTYGRKDDADRRKSLAKTPVANTGAKKKRKKSQGGTSGGSGAAAPSNADQITSWVALWKKDEKAEQRQYQEAYWEKFRKEPPETRENRMRITVSASWRVVRGLLRTPTDATVSSTTPLVAALGPSVVFSSPTGARACPEDSTETFTVTAGSTPVAFTTESDSGSRPALSPPT